MFPDLPGATFDDDRLLALGIEGSICDGGACDSEGHVEAGQPFFGQYIAHDLTADRSPLRAHGDIEALRNVRSPRANLEALYGGGPVGSPYLYDQADPAKLLPGLDGRDVPRNQQGIALIGDPRNDVHAFMTGLQVAFIHAHTASSIGCGLTGFPSPSCSRMLVAPSPGTSSGSSSMTFYRTWSARR